ncbi:MAG: RNA polymerase factor sigma-54 [Bacteroidales bacterium]|nr:RNA polymerase factor sigma-54 [Bacteroidales bacterium]
MKQVQQQQLQQKLSPQQIQLMRLLQLPVTDLEQAIKEEIEKNPLLEADVPASVEDIDSLASAADHDRSDWDADEDDDYNAFDYREHLESDPNATRREFVLSDSLSFADRLNAQLITRRLSDRQQLIANELIGTLDDAGYLSRDLDLVTNDMAFRQGIDASRDEVLEVLRIIQSLDPPGIGARNLQECLLLQLERMISETSEYSEHSDYSDNIIHLALTIIRDHFDDFANHRYERICNALAIDQATLDRITTLIRRLNPKPGSSDADSDSAAATFTPDIILQQHDGELSFYLNDGNLPRLNLNTYYTDLLAQYEAQKADRDRRGIKTPPSERETLSFLRTKQADAQGFIDLLQQRHDTIVRVMRYIIRHQRRFLLSGDPDQMQPLRQREVADATGLDISTVSRMANSKYLQTDFGTIPLKDCFSKGMANNEGEEISVQTIKQRLADAIQAEDKQSPLSDEALAQLLNAQGYPLARRTVAKYREQLGYPVARLRRVLMLLVLLLSTALSPLAAQVSYYDSLINARLEASRQMQAPGRSAHAQPATKATPQSKAESKQAVKAIRDAAKAPATEVDETSRALVPLWYDAFPHHRVNPLGRTTLDLLPDEINLLLVRDSTDFCFPVRNPKTSNYGWRWQRGHHGVDIGLNTGDPVRCAFPGVVRVAARMGGYGNCIVVRHPNGLETLYGHLSKINVQPNQPVAAGDIIGLGGSTGNSTGPHLHFECRFLYQTFDPEWILDFTNYSLRTRRLHLDKTYFGIQQPRKGQSLDYKADQSIIKETKNGKKRPAVPTATTYSIKDF